MQFSSFFAYPEGAEAPTQDELVFWPNSSEEDWAELLSYTETQRFHIGDVIIEQGATDRGLYFIAEGRLEVLAAIDDGQRWLHLADLNVGAVFGEQAFFDAKPRSALVRAISDGSVMRLSPEDFERLAGREPTLAHAILFDLGRILSLRLRQSTRE